MNFLIFCTGKGVIVGPQNPILGVIPPPFLEHLYRRDTCYRHCECSDKTSTTVLALFRCAADSVGELRLTDEVSDRDESKDWDSAEHGCIKPSGPCG